MRNGLRASEAEQTVRDATWGFVMFPTSREVLDKNERHVARHTFNPARRKRASEDAGGIQARNRRELLGAILHNQLGWQECQGVSHAGLGRDRAQAGGIARNAQ